MPIKDILFGLSAAFGPAGAEDGAARLAAELLSDFVPARVDHMGNVIAEMGDASSSKHILLEAHIDEIGMIVTYIDDDGFIKADKCGGADRRVLTGAEVWVLGKTRLPGVICCMPPHLVKPDDDSLPEWDSIYIDVGLPAEKTREQIPPGSRIIPRVKSSRLLGGRVSAKALDNRAGVAAVIRCVEILSGEKEPLPCRVTLLLSSGEEVSGPGSGCAAYSITSQTEAPIKAIIVDTGYGDQPDVPDEKSGKLGGGPTIATYPVLDRAITQELMATADRHAIPWQHEVGGGRTGTSADIIAAAGAGVRCGLVSVPLRNMHTPAEMADLADIENTALLLSKFIMHNS
ncbi:MAG: M20/M25/M40 family metallo-hydrolase [Oscillospiraceae bacterium]|nr:M20/M25/M40 family metallo-hydrolase [Oscillospiraceae bacterium]